MSTSPRAALTRIELNELIRTHSLPFVLARRLARFLAALMIVISLTALLSCVTLLLNAVTPLSLFSGSAPVQTFLMVVTIGLVLSVVPGIVGYISIPRSFDRSMKIKESIEAPAGDREAAEINQKLSDLGADLQSWLREGLTRRHSSVYVSESISSNVVTYGNFDRARIVFARDVLDSMNHEQLRGILAHETGHVENNDFLMGCMFAQITTILAILYLPFKLLIMLVRLIFNPIATSSIPIISAVATLVNWALQLTLMCISMPLWLPRALLCWEGQLAEYVADDFGVALGGSASGLITSLMKLQEMHLEAPRSGQQRKYDLFATVVRYGRRRETNSALADLAQFLSEIEQSHPVSGARWRRLAHLGFQDERIK